MNHHSPFEPICDEPKPLVRPPFFDEPKPVRKKPNRVLRILGIAVVAVLGSLTFDEIADWEDGKPKMKEKWRRQMEKEMEELDNAEQYVLTAKMTGFFPCLKCQKPFIRLKEGEVYRYGVTKKGKAGRYTDAWLEANNLIYSVQFRGNIRDCLREEKRKIFSYPFLPENYLRAPIERLIKPPGNLRTD